LGTAFLMLCIFKKKKKLKKTCYKDPAKMLAYVSWVLVAHTCNPSYLGGRSQEEQGLRPAQANRLKSQKYSAHKKGPPEWLKW
jgi:hypothetical protein